MKFQAISIIFIIAIVSVSLLIQSCKSSLFGYVTVSGTVLYSCSGNPVSNEIVSLVKYGSRGGTETTSTNSSGYFNFKTLSTGDGVDGWGIQIKNVGIGGCYPGCSDVNLFKCIFPIQPYPILQLNFVFDSVYNSNTVFRWQLDTLSYDPKTFKNGTIFGPYNSIQKVTLIDSLSFLLDYYSDNHTTMIPNEVSQRKLKFNFKGRVFYSNISFGYCTNDTQKFTINIH